MSLANSPTPSILSYLRDQQSKTFSSKSNSNLSSSVPEAASSSRNAGSTTTKRQKIENQNDDLNYHENRNTYGAESRGRDRFQSGARDNATWNAASRERDYSGERGPIGMPNSRGGGYYGNQGYNDLQRGGGRGRPYQGGRQYHYHPYHHHETSQNYPASHQNYPASHQNYSASHQNYASAASSSSASGSGILAPSKRAGENAQNRARKNSHIRFPLASPTTASGNTENASIVDGPIPAFGNDFVTIPKAHTRPPIPSAKKPSLNSNASSVIKATAVPVTIAPAPIAVIKQHAPLSDSKMNIDQQQQLLSDSDDEELALLEGGSGSVAVVTSSVNVNIDDIKRKMERYNSKLAVVASSIASLTKERSNLMKKIQVCEDVLLNTKRGALHQQQQPLISSSSASASGASIPSTTRHVVVSAQQQSFYPPTGPGQLVPSSTASEVASASQSISYTSSRQSAESVGPSSQPPKALSSVSGDKNADKIATPSSSANLITAARQIPFNPFISGRSWKLQSCADMQIIKSANTQRLGKLARKPRNLLLYPHNQFPSNSSNESLQDLGIIPTVNGDIQMFDLKNQDEIPALSKNVLFGTEGWSEEVNWVTPDTLAFSLHPTNASSLSASTATSTNPPVPPSVEQGLTLLRNCSIDRMGIFRYDVCRYTQTPHSKMIMAIEPVSRGGQSSSGGDSQFTFATGGADRTVQLWSVSDSFAGKRTASPTFRQLHTSHTSEVISLYYNNDSRILYSGGKDTRLIGYDFGEGGRVVFGGERGDNMIKEILPVSMQPKLLVIGGYQKINASSEFSIFDMRSQSHVLKIARGPSTGAYRKASIHSHGMLLLSGDCGRDVCVWDLRYIKVNSEFQRLKNLHGKSVVCTKFYERGSAPSVLLSIGSDNELLVSDYERGR